jgi:pilus assembly protein CpaE
MNGTRIKTLLALDDGVAARTIESALPATGPLQVVGIAEGIDKSWTLLEESSPDLLVVATAGHSERALFLIETTARQAPERPIVVLSTDEANGFLRRAFEAGADDLLVLPQSPEQITFTIEKVLARRRGATTETEQAPMIAVLGPKGGTGKTVTSCNLAVALAKEGKRVALVDLDLQFGDVGIALGLKPERTIYDLARAGGSLDAEKVESFLTVHPGSGLRVLLAPTRPDQAGLVSVDLLRDAYRVLRSTSDVVVVDTSPSFAPEVIATVDLATHLCLVGMLDASSLKDSKLGLETLELMGRELADVKFVLNRSTAKVGISHNEAEGILGRRVDVLVPEDREVPRTVTEGRPIVLASERSAVARAYSGLARDYIHAFDPASHQNGNGNGRRKSWFGLGRRNGKG